MQGHFFLQDMVDAIIDYIRSGSSEDELKALNAFLTAEERGYSRKQLDNACNNVVTLLSSPLTSEKSK